MLKHTKDSGVFGTRRSLFSGVKGAWRKLRKTSRKRATLVWARTNSSNLLRNRYHSATYHYQTAYYSFEEARRLGIDSTQIVEIDNLLQRYWPRKRVYISSSKVLNTTTASDAASHLRNAVALNPTRFRPTLPSAMPIIRQQNKTSGQDPMMLKKI